jgi:altronate dehydratase
MMTSDFEQTDTGIRNSVKVLSSSDCSAAVNDEAEIAMKLIVESLGTDDLRSLLMSNPSLIENAQDWVRSVLRNYC